MSYYYYQLPQPEEVDDSVHTTVSLRYPNRGNRQPPTCQQYQHHHDNRPYRPRASTESIPFADAEATSGQPRAGNLSREAATSSSEETVNRNPPCPNIKHPRITSSAGTASSRRRRRCSPSTPSPPATFLDSEDAASLNNLLDALDDLDVVEEDRRSSLATTGSSRDDEMARDEEALVVHNVPPRTTLASILISIPPPTTPPPPENETDVDIGEQQQHQHVRRHLEQLPTRINNASFVLPPSAPPKEDNQQKVSSLICSIHVI
ncbi:uncharacterized protein LOC110830093 isoform X2 [Zootermopsis nevadensis]|uniref:uncharacterized protein LOC110830093 isoform X2 n=1 Tax=Zootermopsis nevadensis TaxID=136037 RepID=UPI000B8E7ABC|nr:uncharacterized protein LOC110830093 isoform X2 [Zootermopsis nevadensis]